MEMQPEPHQTYCTPGIVDSTVAHKQAWARLTDRRTKGERTIVHAHRFDPNKNLCGPSCEIYHECETDSTPRRHSIGEMCPEPDDGIVVI